MTSKVSELEVRRDYLLFCNPLSSGNEVWATGDCPFGDEGIREGIACAVDSRVKTIYLTRDLRHGVSAFLAAAALNPTLELLCLQNQRFGNDTRSAFVALGQSGANKKLNIQISRCKFTSAAFDGFVAGISRNLMMSDFELKWVFADARKIDKLLRVLATLPVLKEADLSCSACHLNREAIQALRSARPDMKVHHS